MEPKSKDGEEIKRGDIADDKIENFRDRKKSAPREFLATGAGAEDPAVK